MDSSEIAKYAWKHICGNVILPSPRPAGTMSYTGAPCARLMTKPELSGRRDHRGGAWTQGPEFRKSVRSSHF